MRVVASTAWHPYQILRYMKSLISFHQIPVLSLWLASLPIAIDTLVSPFLECQELTQAIIEVHCRVVSRYARGGGCFTLKPIQSASSPGWKYVSYTLD